jgi:hypothetical protein
MNPPPVPESKKLQLILFLWGLLLTKCFALEFLVRQYEVPIDSLTYVWMLSLVMASVATLVYAKLHSAGIRQLAKTPVFRVNAIVLLATAVLVAWNVAEKSADSPFIMILVALLLAAKNTWLWLQETSPHARRRALGWIFAIGAITYFGSPTAFLIFAIHIFTFTVISHPFKSSASEK